MERRRRHRGVGDEPGRGNALTTTASRQIADFAARLRFGDLPEAVLERGQVHILDALGLAIAGAESSACRIARAHVSSLGISANSASILGTAEKTAPRFAALINGAAMHADNFDDTSPQQRPTRNGGIHATAAILPAALALAEEKAISGRDFATAFHAGNEVACRLSHAIAARHYDSGFHYTATLNTFGAAVTAAMLSGLERLQIEHALAFAASTAAGVRHNFGSMVEILHPGFAAESGILAAEYAERGLTGGDDALGGRAGYFEASAGGLQAEITLGAPWAFIEPGVSIKPFPSGALTHPAMTGLLEIRRDRGLGADDVAAIRVRTNPRIHATLAHHDPRTAMQARFSMEFCLAVALVEGGAGLAAFTDAATVRSDIRAVMDRITFDVFETPGRDYTNMTTLLDITLNDGEMIARRIDWAIGAAQAPMPFSEVVDKARGCAAHAGWPDARIEGLIEAVASLATLEDAGALARLASAPR